MHRLSAVSSTSHGRGRGGGQLGGGAANRLAAAGLAAAACRARRLARRLAAARLAACTRVRVRVVGVARDQPRAVRGERSAAPIHPPSPNLPLFPPSPNPPVDQAGRTRPRHGRQRPRRHGRRGGGADRCTPPTCSACSHMSSAAAAWRPTGPSRYRARRRAAQATRPYPHRAPWTMRDKHRTPSSHMSQSACARATQRQPQPRPSTPSRRLLHGGRAPSAWSSTTTRPCGCASRRSVRVPLGRRGSGPGTLTGPPSALS